MSEFSSTSLREFIQTPARRVTAQGIEIGPLQAALFDAGGKSLLVSFIGALPSFCGALEAVRAFFGDTWQPGDVALTNDMDAGAFNACEMIAVAPIYSGTSVTGWSAVRGRVPDFGGWEPGGYSPQAVDRWAEGARLEPVKVMLGGSYRREVTDLVRLNSRTPVSTLQNVRLLAQAAVELGQSYAARTQDDAIAKLRADELRQAKAALGALSLARATLNIDVVAPWLNRAVGSISVALGKSADTINVNLSGSPVAACPVNLGRYAAEDLAVGAIATASGLDGLITDALVSCLHIEVRGLGIVCAPLPATVGLGRQIAGESLFKAILECLGGAVATSESGWKIYHERACGSAIDPGIGKLATSNTARIRELQSKEVAA